MSVRPGEPAVSAHRTRELIAAIVVGALGALLTFGLSRRPGFHGDFLAWWYAAQQWLAGNNPYTNLPGGPPYFTPEPFFYPFTAVVAALPIARVEYVLARVLFFGVGSALLGWAIARHRPHCWPMLVSFPYLVAAQLGHWAPFLATALLVPALGFFITIKPNVGLAMLAARPSRPMIIGAVALVALSFVFWPTWPVSWLQVIRAAPSPHPVPMASWLGAPLILAALRWRDPDARLLLATAILPQTAMFADQLVLGTIARTRQQSALLSLASIAGGIAWMFELRNSNEPAALVGVPYVTAAIYLPALVLILLRRRQGNEPH